jgi:hypothetical protein
VSTCGLGGACGTEESIGLFSGNAFGMPKQIGSPSDITNQASY